MTVPLAAHAFLSSTQLDTVVSGGPKGSADAAMTRKNSASIFGGFLLFAKPFCKGFAAHGGVFWFI